MLPAQRYPPANRGLILVWSLIGALPVPGTTWHRIQYLAGLRRLGFDVWYVEESGCPLQDPITLDPAEGYRANLEYLKHHMELIGLGDRWIFQPPGQKDYFGGGGIERLRELYRDADLVIDHTGVHNIWPWHSKIRRLAYLETDPGGNQVRLAGGNQKAITKFSRYDHLFTYAENLGAPDCELPQSEFRWIPTRPAICVDWWATGKASPTSSALRTIMTWSHGPGAATTWGDKSWSWVKAGELQRFIDLPARSSLPLELALRGAKADDLEALRRHGWRIVPASELTNTSAYRDYIRGSLGEFTITKNLYSAPRSGWFSDRSACFLAAGRPVVSQDTGFSNILPSGQGLHAFRTAAEALEAIRLVADDYDRQSAAASEIAADCFSAERVIGRALGAIGLM